MKKYIVIPVKMHEELFDIALFALEEFPFCGIEEQFDLLRISFDEKDYSDDLLLSVSESLDNLDIEYEIGKIDIVEDRNWNEEWEKQLKPVRVNNRIAFTPSMKTDEVDAEVKIIVDPKMSFGTGEHATTRLVASMMDGTVEKDSFWIDAGCGTGALATLAVKLGARACFAFDYDEWSVKNTAENIELNGVQEYVEVAQADILETELPEADGIAANLFISLIKDSMGKFYKALKRSKGVLIVSGVMTFDADIAIKKAEEVGFFLDKHIKEDEWSAFLFRVS